MFLNNQRVKVINRASAHHGEYGHIDSRSSSRGLWAVKLDNNLHPQLFSASDLMRLGSAPAEPDDPPEPEPSLHDSTPDPDEESHTPETDASPSLALDPPEPEPSSETPEPTASSSEGAHDHDSEPATVVTDRVLAPGTYELGRDTLSLTLEGVAEGASWEIEVPPGLLGCQVLGDEPNLPLKLSGGYTYVIEKDRTGLLIYTY